MTATVYESVSRAFRRKADSPRGAPGELVFDPDGLSVRFYVGASEESIHALDYRCSSCATLMAVCEQLTDLAAGMTVRQAMNLTPDDLLALYPDLPSMGDRAALAVAAFRSAILNRQQ